MSMNKGTVAPDLMIETVMIVYWPSRSVWA